MRDDVINSLKAIVSGLGSGARPPAERGVARLSDAGVRSFEDLLSIARGRECDAEVRSFACWALGQLRDKRGVEALLSTCADEDVGVAWEASKALGAIGDKRAVPQLIDLLLDYKLKDRHEVAAYALGLLCDKRAVEPLLYVLSRQSETPAARGHAAEALALIGDARAVPALIDSLNDVLPEVRFWSAFALGELGDVRVIPELERLATTDEGVLQGWGRIADEAAKAVELIRSKHDGQS